MRNLRKMDDGVGIPAATIAKKPSRHFRLVCWRLLFRVAVWKDLDRNDEIAACFHARMPLEQWDLDKTEFPRQWDKLLAKRKRRLDWFLANGSIPSGWTPPDPKDPKRSVSKPIRAYLARRGLTLEEFMATHVRVTFKSKTGGRQTKWRLIDRVSRWFHEVGPDLDP